ncbi:MAG: hypothetical protein Q8O17_06030, partial [Candidatus Methanoperedens sp.]|nr:hypothetical protein [Candidatus Methanoperedens sp.]
MDNKAKSKKIRKNNPLHKKIGNIIQVDKYPNCRVVKSSECGGTQYIPLFCSTLKGNDTEYCNVDLLILKNNKIKVIVEIEESNTTPTQICGKVLVSSLSSNHIHKYVTDETISMDDSVLFIQILDTSKIKNRRASSKFEQWKNL